ncbi:MFS transporter [Actinopolymorpha sp. B11F2]|uniref:MFS transporter n=1 Tax=Actinopolymorpha sp. B11F2 TaxID=3160862 RepID=UPI0032E494CF
MSSRAAAPPAAPTHDNRWWLVVAVGLAVFMAMLDMTIVGIALPNIGAEFGASPDALAWALLGYLLPLVGLTLPAGRWLDRVGKRSALVASTGGFVLASVAAGLSPNIGWLVGARVVQGCCAAVLFALGPAIAAAAVRPEARGRAFSLVATVGPLGGVTGPALGGLLVDGLGWPWTFYINLPVGLAVIGIGLAQLPAEGVLRWPERGLIAEAALLSVAALTLLGGMSLGASRGVGWLLLTVVAIPPACAWQRSTGGRHVRRLLQLPGVWHPHAALLTQATSAGVVVFLIPFYLQGTLDLSATTTGLTILAFPLAALLFGPAGGVLADCWSARGTALIGVSLFALGIVATVPLSPAWTVADLAWRLALIGAGAGLFSGPNQAVAMSAAPRMLHATTGATTSLARQLGFSLGPALATTAWAVAGYSTFGMRTAMAVATGAGCIALLTLARGAWSPRPAKLTHAHF